MQHRHTPPRVQKKNAFISHTVPIAGAAHIERCQLPREVRAAAAARQRHVRGAAAGARTGQRECANGESAKRTQHRLPPVAKQQRGALEAERAIVWRVLNRVDGVCGNVNGGAHQIVSENFFQRNLDD